MKRIFFVIVVAWGLVAGSDLAQAQADQKRMPQAPYLASVPDYGHWIVTFKYIPDASTSAASGPGGAAANPPAAPVVPDGSPTAIETIKTGDLRGVTLTFGDGTSKLFTCQGDWVLCSTPKGPQFGIATPTAQPYAYYTTGFILLDGVKVNPSTFKETVPRNGVFAFHYKSGDADIWIDPGSMLPLAVKVPGIEVSYQFLTPPPKPFDIPKDQESLLQKEQSAYKATSSMR
jgi:hypothetical protein